MKPFLPAAMAILASSAFGFTPPSAKAIFPTSTARSMSEASPTEEAFVIDSERRALMNVIVLGSATVTVGAMAVPYLAFFFPPSPGDSTGAIPAKDALGNDIFLKEYLKLKPAGDRSLVQGLKGDAAYLIVKDNNTLQEYALNAICTHLGCVVPWSAANNKFMCPCHGSQYDVEGSVIRGPAPLPLALEHTSVDEASGKIMFSPWPETDFRTGEKAWWN